MAREQVNTRLDPDHAERVEQYADDHGITKAEAARRLILTGLDVEEGKATVPADEIRDDLNRLRTELRERDDDAADDSVTLRMSPRARTIGGVLIALLLLALLLTEAARLGLLG